MTGSNSISDENIKKLNSTIEHLIDALNRRQTGTDTNNSLGRWSSQMYWDKDDDGSSMSKKGREKTYRKIRNEQIQAAKDRLIKNGATVGSKNYQKNLEKAIRIIDKKLEKSGVREQIKRQADEKAYATLTNGRNRQMIQFGRGLERTSHALNGLAGGKGPIAGVARGLTKFGGKLAGSANVIGAAIEAIKTVFDIAGRVMEWHAQYYRYDTEKINIQNQLKRQRLEIGGNIVQARQQNTIDKLQAEQNNAISLATEGNAIVTNAEATAHQIATQSLFDIKGGAYAAAEAAIRASGQIYNFRQNEKFGEAMVASQKRVADEQLRTTERQAKAQLDVAETTAETQTRSVNVQQGWHVANGVVGAVDTVTGGMASEIVGGGMRGTKAEHEAHVERENLLKQFGADYKAAFVTIDSNLKNQAVQANEAFTQNTIQLNKTLSEQTAQAVQEMQMAWLKMSQTVFDEFQKIEPIAYNMGRGMNFNTEQLSKYARSLSHSQLIVSEFGKDMEFLNKMQTSFQEETGRNRMFTNNEFLKNAAFGTLVGDDVVAQLNSGMEPFNMAIDDANDKFFEMYKEVSKIGLNGRKFTKQLVNDLKLADKYNFKGGVQGLMEMSKWAQNVKFNTNSLDGMLNKVQEGGLEGVIQQAAELQVLGGNFAMGADPLALAYESFDDPEAFAKRANSMLKGMGRMGNDGQVKIDMTQRQLLNQYAKSMGMDIKDVINQVKQNVKLNTIKGQLNPNLNEDEQSLIANKAEYKDGRWVVNVGKDESGNDIIRDVNNITADDVKSMTNQDDTKSLEESVRAMFSTTEEMKNAEKKIMSRLQSEKWDKMADAAINLTQNIKDEFDKNFKTYSDNLTRNLSLIVKEQGTYLNEFNQSIKDETSAWNKVGEELYQIQENLWKHLTGTNDSVRFYIEEAKAAIVHALTGEDAENAGNVINGVSAEEERRLTQGVSSMSSSERINKYNKNQEKLDNWERSGRLSIRGKVYDSSTNEYKHTVATHKRENEIIKEYNAFERATPIGGGLYNPVQKTNDGFVSQNGVLTRIDSEDQVLAAKKDGPLDRMLDMVEPRPMPYDSQVSEKPHSEGRSGSNDNKIEIPPIQISITGNLQLNGVDGNTELMAQISKDPNFIRSISQLISIEVEKKVNGGRVSSPLNRSLKYQG